MKYIYVILLLVLTVTLCSCAMPVTSVKTIDDRPALAIKNAPEGAVLFVDGLNMGLAGQYDGDPKTLTVESGTHLVKIVVNGDAVFERKVFVESSLKTISIR